MSKKEKRGLLLLVVIAIVIITVIFLVVKRGDNGKGEAVPTENTVKEEYVKVLEDGTKLNTSTVLSKTKNADGLEVSNIQLTYANGISTVLANVKNTTSTDTPATDLIIKFYDKQGNLLLTLPGIVDPIPAGGTVQLNTNVTADFANVYDFTVEKK